MPPTMDRPSDILDKVDFRSLYLMEHFVSQAKAIKQRCHGRPPYDKDDLKGVAMALTIKECKDDSPDEPRLRVPDVRGYSR
jgi:hypothetical protein